MSKFAWRPLETGDYEMLQTWWSKWGWPSAPTLDMLPFGALVYVKETGTPVYAGFLYESGTSIGWLEFVVCNKQASVEDRRGGLDYLVETLGTVAKFRGIKSLFTSTLSQGFVNSLKKTGFDVGDVGMTQLIKQL